MRQETSSGLRRTALARFALLGVASVALGAFGSSASAAAAAREVGAGFVQVSEGRVRLASPSDSIELDRDAGVLWINRQAIVMDAAFLADIARAEEQVVRDPTPRGLQRAAATFSRETLVKLQAIRDALNRPEDLISLAGLEQCGPDGIGVVAASFAWYFTCTAAVASTGGAAAPCYVAMAAWTGTAWKVGDCMGRNQPRRGPRGADNDPYSDGDGDGLIDVLDGCPLDPLKFEHGVCGCGARDVDDNGDGTIDCLEVCPGGCDDDDDDDECTPLEILSGQCD